MSETSHPNIPLWVQERIVDFFNSVFSVQDITNGPIEDDPSNGAGNTIGPSLAAKILRTRNALPRRRFTDLEQIDNISGVGPDTIRDLVYSFGRKADEEFRRSMYAEGTIFEANWPLEFFRFEFEELEHFLAIARSPENLRIFIHGKIAEVAAEKGVAQSDIDAMQADVLSAYIDKYSNSTPIAAYAFALYFYDFDADNWFAWETIQEQTLEYFDHNMSSNNWQMDLFQFRGFRNRRIVQPGISPDVLPVVCNWAEQSVTFWISELYD